MTRLKQNLQQENKARIERKDNYKRDQIWETHRDLREKNEKKSNTYRLQQCFVRTESIFNRKGKESTYQFINSLKKADPNKINQRDKLMEALQLLNSKLNLGLKLKAPPKY
jgi:hypothetical protein